VAAHAVDRIRLVVDGDRPEVEVKAVAPVPAMVAVVMAMMAMVMKAPRPLESGPGRD
jgi:hypothetical protein